MERITVAKNGKYLMRDAHPFFYLGDTVWMAFQKLSLVEWREYLAFRREQGFNVAQISLLPISHDSSIGTDDISPFMIGDDGKPDFMAYNPVYFDKAERMVAMAGEYEITCALHLLWANYLPDTWASKRPSGTPLPREAVRPLIRYTCERFSKYRPVYSVSGDVSFESQKEIDYYLEAMEELDIRDPDALVTLHLQPHAVIPEELLNSTHLDFYTYQGGHTLSEQYRHYDSAVNFSALSPKRPVINTEPCYEGHGRGSGEYGKYSASDVRRAAWQSLLSGASAGIGYGAHGLWSLQHHGDEFTSLDFSGIPFHWRTALNFPAAGDMVFAKILFERYNLFALEPEIGLVTYNDKVYDAIRAAKSLDGNTIAIYLPYAAQVTVNADLSACNVCGYLLESRMEFVPEQEFKNGTTILHMPQKNQDMLYIFTM